MPLQPESCPVFGRRAGSLLQDGKRYIDSALQVLAGYFFIDKGYLGTSVMKVKYRLSFAFSFPRFPLFARDGVILEYAVPDMEAAASREES